MRPVVRYILLLIGILALGTVLYMTGLTLFYLRAIQKGNTTALPQFSNRFTVSNARKIASTSELVNLATTDDPSLGKPDAPLTIVEFADFECPFSKEVYGRVREIAAANPDKVRVIFRDMPLSDIHTNATPAALAANCAGAQGKFWAMHDKLFARAPALAQKDLIRYADEIGLDRAKFTACMNDPKMLAELEEDYEAGVAAGIRGTPTFFFNGARVEGAIPQSVLNSMVKGFVE